MAVALFVFISAAGLLHVQAQTALSVNAGADQSVTLPDALDLVGTYDSAGYEGVTPTILWKQVGGSGTTTFSHADQVGTSVSFGEAGDYTLQFSVDLHSDTVNASGTDTVLVHVISAPADVDDGANDADDTNDAGDTKQQAAAEQTPDADESSSADVTPPTLLSFGPNETLPVGVNQVTLTLITDENATCKYNITAGASYTQMTNPFSVTGGSEHSTVIHNLLPGTSYYFYVRCIDESSNANLSDYVLPVDTDDVSSLLNDMADDGADDSVDDTSDDTTPDDDPIVPSSIPDTFDDIDTNVQYVDYVHSVYVPDFSRQVSIKKAKDLPPLHVAHNMKLNDKGPEVLLLKKTLNLLGFTIATSGPNSIGKETSTFDAQTVVALTKYQAGYQEGGLVPTGKLDNVTLLLINSDINRLVAIADGIPTTTPHPRPTQSIVSLFLMRFNSALGDLAGYVIRMFK